MLSVESVVCWVFLLFFTCAFLYLDGPSAPSNLAVAVREIRKQKANQLSVGVCAKSLNMELTGMVVLFTSKVAV